MKEKITIAILLCAIAFLFVTGCTGNNEYYMSSSEVDAIISGISSRRPSGSNSVVSDDTYSDGEDEIETSSDTSSDISSKESSSEKPSVTVSTSSKEQSSTPAPSSSEKPESSSSAAETSSETSTSSESTVPPTEGDDGEDEISGNKVHIGAPPGVMPPV